MATLTPEKAGKLPLRYLVRLKRNATKIFTHAVEEGFALYKARIFSEGKKIDGSNIGFKASGEPSKLLDTGQLKNAHYVKAIGAKTVAVKLRSGRNGNKSNLQLGAELESRYGGKILAFNEKERNAVTQRIKRLMRGLRKSTIK